MDKIRDPCLGSKSKKNKRHSVLEKIIRKPSSNNPAASMYCISNGVSNQKHRINIMVKKRCMYTHLLVTVFYSKSAEH